MSRARALVGSGWRWAIPALLLLAPFLLWPLASMLGRGIAPGGTPSITAIEAVVSDGYYWNRLAFTFFQALASTVLALLVGLPAAYVFAVIRFPGRDVLKAVVTLPFVLPTIVVALAFQRLLGPEGWFSDALGVVGLGPVQAMGTLWIVLLAHVFYNVAIVIRLVSSVWANLNPNTEEAALLLGAGRWMAFQLVTLRELLPAIASASALVFTFAFTSFGVVLILGGPNLDTLEVAIYRLATRLVQLPEAAVLSFVQLAATLSALTLYASLQRRTATAITLRADRATPLGETPWSSRLILAAVLLVLGALIVAPLLALVAGAFGLDGLGSDGGPTIEHFRALFTDSGRVSYIPPLDAVRWSLTFAVGAMLIAVPVGVTAAMAIARSRGRLGSLVDAALMLPIAVPAVVLGFGYLTTFNRAPLDLRGSPWLVLAAHALLAYPFVLRAVLAVLRSLDPQLLEAARLLGASPRAVVRFVEIPMAARAILVGAVFTFAVSLGEFGATLLLRRREFATMPIAIFESLGRPGEENLARALAMASILLAVTAVGFVVIERFRYREVGEF